ncbi:MAG: hypothetical protein CBB87_08605 [Micavibrio sp. TMED27]|nr:hypothetical protein [Micavibrio sp.]OUT90725.1 MAG: hypothetical protein CBB87_08605 [Micavibrio sp. TMED27]|tara:strand:- start:507 stop:743 length:237 start_codon:yes stop_codon:yes gene_type:complete
MDDSEKDKIRLSDRILSALELALEQGDLKICELLTSAMEQSMTRNTGGGEFIERRDYPPEIEEAMDKLYALRAEDKNA